MEMRAWAARNLAAKLLAGIWTQDAITAGLDAVLGPGHFRTRRALTTRLIALAETGYPPAHHDLAAYLVASRYFKPPRERPVPAVFDKPRFTPAPPFAALAIPPLTTQADLAAWFGISAEQIDWLADEYRCHGRTRVEPLQQYRYAFASKRSGSPRLIEAPKPRLKAIQRRILHEILVHVPVHPSAHGFVAGRSCLSGAQIHASEAVVVTFDLAQFFPSIRLARVLGLFRSLGYPWDVAHRLAGLCTTMTPASVFARLPEVQRPSLAIQACHRAPHLPQGAPTSPALANLLAFTLDLRLHGLARALGANYTRYADDLAFSSDAVFAAGLSGFTRTVGTIVRDEGFTLNLAKTKVMPRERRQRVTGIVVNEHCNTGRAEFETVKAILHHCRSRGPADQNRADVPDFRRHLDGRIAWVEQVNPRRGAKLRGVFDEIRWD